MPHPRSSQLMVAAGKYDTQRYKDYQQELDYVMDNRMQQGMEGGVPASRGPLLPSHPSPPSTSNAVRCSRNWRRC